MPKGKISGMLGAAWAMAAATLQYFDPVNDDQGRPIYELKEEELELLGSQTENLMRTMPKSKKTSVHKFLERNMPTIMFSYTVGMVFAPRIVYSMESHKRARQGKPPPRTATRADQGVHKAPPAAAATPHDAADDYISREFDAAA